MTTRRLVSRPTDEQIQKLLDQAGRTRSEYADGVLDTLDWVFGAGDEPDLGQDS